jgi:putative ABC transport system permease protein
MMFVARMALRETRASWKRLLFFFVCIAVGVAAIIAIRSLVQNVRVALGREVKALTAGDVVIRTNRDWKPEVRATLDTRLREAGATGRTELIETMTMARPADETRKIVRMVELRAVQPSFPLYGQIVLEDDVPYSHDLLKDHGAIVRPELLTTFDLRIGDSIVIGQQAFVIRALLKTEPGSQGAGFALGPRVLIDFDDAFSTGLVQFGSRVGRSVLVKVPEPNIAGLVSTLRTDFQEEFVRVRSYRSEQNEITDQFGRAENYLSLVGLVIVILGGIAVSSVTRVFVLQKIRSIAVLKCVGATSVQIIAVYLVQVLALGFAGSLLAVALAHLVVASVPLVVSDTASLLARVEYGITRSAAVQGIGVGVLVSLLFSIVPLLRVRLVKPSLLLRAEPVAQRDWVRAAAIVAVAGALVALTSWQVSSLRVGAIVFSSLCGLALVLQIAAEGLVRLIAPLAEVRSFPLRHAVLHLSRPGNQTRVILMAVGLGAFFIVGVRSLQASLLKEFSIEVSTDSPDMFLMDVQRDQARRVTSFLADPAQGGGQFRLIPVVRARVTGIQGRRSEDERFENVRGRLREYTVTYRDSLQPNERLIDGKFWNGASPDPEVSIERELRDRLNLKIGDLMRFDILGRMITARVTSVREVNFQDTRSGGFIIVFRPGTLEDAPQTYIVPLKAPDEPAARARFQHALVQQFPNVSVIDFHAILVTVRDVMSKVTLAITVVGGLVLFSGALILIGAVAMTKFQQVFEASVFKTLGATTGAIAQMLVLEYAVLGLLAGAIGSAGAMVLTWAVSRFALEIPWRLFPGDQLASVVITTVLVAAIGVLSSLDVLRHKPLATLRAE